MNTGMEAQGLWLLRAGYFYESPHAGGRKFATFGAGVRYSIVGVDFDYISTFEENHPLANTLGLQDFIKLWRSRIVPKRAR
ncbi:MAG: hypothetical protein ABDI07_02990 [Candidatus Kryptonium sp.]